MTPAEARGAAAAGASAPRRPGLARAALGVALALAIGWVVFHRGELDASALEARLAALGRWGPLAFVGLYAVGTVLFLPGSVLTITGGALFGPLPGALYSLVGATLGATASFLIARHLAADLVSRRAGPRLKQVLDGVADRGWRFVAFVRLVPLLPFNALNYVLGVTPVRVGPYVVTSFVCMLPGALVYAHVGHASREVATGEEGGLKAALVAASLLVALTLLPTLVRRRASGGAARAAGSAEPDGGGR